MPCAKGTPELPNHVIALGHFWCRILPGITWPFLPYIVSPIGENTTSPQVEQIGLVPGEEHMLIEVTIC